jgi:putative transposase
LPAGRLALHGIAHIKVKWHRPLPASATVRTVCIRRAAGRWYVSFSLQVTARSETPARARPPVGIDLGITHFAALSTGELVRGPRAYQSSLRRLKVAQRRVSRRTKGSCRRQKAVLLLARQHERVRNLRRDHAHKLSRRLVSDFGVIVLEDLRIRGLARGILAKYIADQAWAAFRTMLEYKAAEAGTQLIRVSPAGTSQTCSGCGTVVPKLLSERIHRCLDCGLVIDRT